MNSSWEIIESANFKTRIGYLIYSTSFIQTIGSSLSFCIMVSVLCVYTSQTYCVMYYNGIVDSLCNIVVMKGAVPALSE